MKNFIGIYDDILPINECEKIIELFEKNPNKTDGICYLNYSNSTLNEDFKKSTDLECYLNDNDFSSILSSLEETTNIYKKHHLETGEISSWCVEAGFNIQRYLPNEGFFGPHCEAGGKTTNNRVLAWMIYLNDVDDGGETRFPSYDLNVKAKAGRVVIWPAFFTHIHHGIVSKTETKYIATGWYSYM